MTGVHAYGLVGGLVASLVCSQAVAQTQAVGPGTSATLATPVQAQSVATTQAETPQCSMAAPSCFGACGANRVQTASGQCVPASVPATSYSKDLTGLTALPMPLDAPSTGPSSPGLPPSPQPCCYVALKVEAIGVKNLGDHEELSSIGVELRINGQLFGRTPFADGLPSGDYWIELTAPGSAVPARAALVELRVGAPKLVQARFGLVLRPAEQSRRDAWRRSQLAAAKAIEGQKRIEQMRRLDALHAEFEQRHGSWERDTEAPRRERHLKLTWGVISGVAGAVLSGTGIAFEVGAQDLQAQARSTRAAWEREPDAGERAKLAARLDEKETKRDLQHGVGLVGLGLGGAGLILAGYLLFTVPTVAEEPRPAIGETVRLAVTPLWTPSSFGVASRLRF